MCSTSTPGLGAVFMPLAILGERRELAVAVFNRFKIRIGCVDHVLARRALPGRHVRQERRARRHKVLHPIRTHVARQNMLYFGDLAIHHFEPQRDDQRPAIFLHNAVEADLIGLRIDGVDLEGRGASDAPTHRPSPIRISAVFSVKRTPRDNGRPAGSCFTSAARYWSVSAIMHARSQCFDPAKEAPVNAANKAAAVQCLIKSVSGRRLYTYRPRRRSI
jgi:hypothetical protein